MRPTFPRSRPLAGRGQGLRIVVAIDVVVAASALVILPQLLRWLDRDDCHAPLEEAWRGEAAERPELVATLGPKESS